MTDNTPLNADDELDRYLFVTWNMKDTVINRAMADGTKKWLKKHELQALRYIQRELINSPKEDWLGTLGEAIDNLKQELEKL